MSVRRMSIRQFQSSSSITSNSSNDSSTHPYKCIICMSHFKKINKICNCRQSLVCDICLEKIKTRNIRKCPLCRSELLMSKKPYWLFNSLIFLRLVLILTFYIIVDIYYPIRIFNDRYFRVYHDTYLEFEKQGLSNSMYNQKIFNLTIIASALIFKPLLLLVLDIDPNRPYRFIFLSKLMSQVYFVLSLIGHLIILNIYDNNNSKQYYLKNYFQSYLVAFNIVPLIGVLILFILYCLIRTIWKQLKLFQYYYRTRFKKLDERHINLINSNIELNTWTRTHIRNETNHNNIVRDQSEIRPEVQPRVQPEIQSEIENTRSLVLPPRLNNSLNSNSSSRCGSSGSSDSNSSSGSNGSIIAMQNMLFKFVRRTGGTRVHPIRNSQIESENNTNNTNNTNINNPNMVFEGNSNQNMVIRLTNTQYRTSSV